MYVLLAFLILYLTFFIKEGFNPYKETRLEYYPDQTKSPNLIYAQKSIQDILDSGVSQKMGEHLDDLLNLLQFI
jgi:hypothetical protein